jgi:tetratricopeptide (TPR) repeat protein
MDQLQHFVNAYGDRYLPQVNGSAFNQVGSAALYHRHFGEGLWAEDSFNIVVGCDSGLLARHVLSHGIPKGTRFLFVELPDLLDTVREDLAGLEMDDHLQLVSTTDWQGALADVPFQQYVNIDRVRVIESLGALDAHLLDYRQALVTLRRELDSLLWNANTTYVTASFVVQQLLNLAGNAVPAACLKDSFKGKSCVLLGGGPSLDAMLPWIAERQHQIVIIAVSRISRRLQQVGLTPHIVVSVDPQDLSFDLSKEMLDLSPQTLFVHSNHVSHKLLAQWHGRSVHFGELFPWESRANKPNFPGAGPTVTNAALHLAANMGFQQVILAGVDLCYSSEGYCHAEGSFEHQSGTPLGVQGVHVPTNAGPLAETRPDFLNAIDHMGRQAAAAQKAGCRVINTAPGAAVIEGVDYLPLDQVAFDATADAPLIDLHRALPPDDADSRRRHLRLVSRELARANGSLRRIHELAEEALHCNDGLFGRNGMQADYKYKKRMDKIERKLDRDFKDISSLVRLFGAKAFLRMPPSDREWSDREIEQAGDTYYQAYRESAKTLMLLVENAQRRIATALEGEKPAPDFQLLLERWREDGLPRLGRVWRERHPQAAQALPASVREAFDALEGEFQDLLRERDRQRTEDFSHHADLTQVLSKLQLYLRDADRYLLQDMAHKLAGRDSPEAEELLHLALGFMAEIDGDPDGAMDRYGEVVERAQQSMDDCAGEDGYMGSPRLEAALRRMSLIAIERKDYPQALLVMDTLSAMNPTYDPQYADLLRLQGEHRKAIDVYTHYLERAPDDLVVMTKLGKLFMQLGVREGARALFGHILRQDPGNEAARYLLAELGGE